MDRFTNRQIVLLGILFFVLAFFFMLVTPSFASAADRYWVHNATSGTGNWSDTSHWSNSTHGSGGFSVPTTADNVYFDSNSFAAASQIVTINTVSYCRNMDWTGATNVPTLTIGADYRIVGNATFIATMTYLRTAGVLYLRDTTYITTSSLTLVGPLALDNSSSNIILKDDWSSGNWVIYLRGGVLNTNSKILTSSSTAGAIVADTTALCTLTMGTSVVNTYLWNFTNGNCNITDRLHTINVSTGSFSGAGLAYGTVNLLGTSHTVSGSNTFTIFSRNGTATKTDTLTLTSGTTQTVTGNCTLVGNSAINRLLVQSTTLGTPATLNVDGGWTGTNAVDFMDITSTHAVDLSSLVTYDKYTGDCQGNSGITFTTSSTQTSGSTATWSTAAKWTSRVPLPQDDVVCTHTTSVDMPRIGRSITFSGTPTVSLSNSITNYGSFTLVSGMVYTHNYKNNYLRGRSSYTFTSAGRTICGIIYLAPSGLLTLQDDIVFATDGIFLDAGSLSLVNRTITCSKMMVRDLATRSINATNSFITANGTGAGGYEKFRVYTTTGLISWDFTNSTLVLTNLSTSDQTFGGGNQLYYNVTVAGVGVYTLTVTGNNTFNTFLVDRTSSNKTLILSADTTQRLSSFVCPTSGSNYLVINSTTTTATSLLKSGGGFINLDYLDLKYNTGTPTSTWFYGSNSIIGANVTGWNTGRSTSRVWSSVIQ